MTKIAIAPNASGTGTFTISAPNSNVDRTFSLPDATGEVLTDQSDIEAQVKTATNASGSAPIYACRAWVNLNGETPSIRASGNVASVTSHGSGDYTINFATAMPDADYAPTFMLGRDGANIDVYSAIHPTILPTASALRIRTAFLSQVGQSAYVNIARINVAIFR